MRYRFHDAVTEQNRRRSRDEAGNDPPNEPTYGNGNDDYVCTLPLGVDYEIESGDDDALLKVNRVDEKGGRQLAIALPKGDLEYNAQKNAAGFHIFSRPRGEPERTPLTGDVSAVDLGYGYKSHSQALIAFNNRNSGPNQRRPVPGSPISTVGQYITDRAKNAAGIKRIADANNAFWKNGERKW